MIKMTINVLPTNGIVTVKDLAEYLDTSPSQLQQRLTDKGIPVLKLSSKFDKRLVRLEDLIFTLPNL